MSFPIRFSSLEEEGIFHSSKWLKHAVLLSADELSFLFSLLEPYFLISSSLVSKNAWNISFEEFLAQYKLYLKWMESEPALPPPEMRRFFSLMLSSSLDIFYAISVGSDKIAIKATKPVIQIQLYHCFFSSFDHQIRSMVTSPDSFGWGIQFAYPQIYEDPKTHQFSKVLLDEGFPNSKPFKEIVSWLRKNTQPVPLQEAGGKAYAPFRIGKNSLEKRKSHVGFQKMLSTGVKICG